MPRQRGQATADAGPGPACAAGAAGAGGAAGATARAFDAWGAVAGSGGWSSDVPQFEQKRPLSGLLVPQRVHMRSGGRGGENSNCGAGGRIGGVSLGRDGAGA